MNDYQLNEDENPKQGQVDNVDTDRTDTSDTVENKEYKEFTNEFFDSLPTVLKSITDTVESTEDKLMMLLGSITASSSVFPNYFGIYGNKKLFTNLYFYVIAAAGAGKGKLTWVKKLVEPVGYFFSNPEEATENMSKIDIASVKQLIASVTDNVRFQNLIIPGNISSAGFIKLLGQNKGRALMMETEGDTINNAFKSDFSNYSDMFRKAYEHETISYYRKTDDEKVILENPQVSVILTSTPKQLFRLIPSAENGLFSRFGYMTIKSSSNFINVFDNGGFERTSKTFEDCGAEVLRIFLHLSSQVETRFVMTESQQVDFLEFFNQMKSVIVNFIDSDLEGSIHRLGSMFFRIAMVQSLFREAENENISEVITCSDVEYNNTKLLIELLISQMIEVFNMLPNVELDQLSTSKANLYRSLPDEFETALAKQQGADFDLSSRTVERFLTENEALFEKVKHGLYRKKIA